MIMMFKNVTESNRCKLFLVIIQYYFLIQFLSYIRKYIIYIKYIYIITINKINKINEIIF